jgi:FkbM family methyltransferase
MTLASRVATSFPEALLVRLISFAYLRDEPEVRHLDEICGRGGTMVDIGGWYGPWARRLARRADKVVVLEPSSLHEVLRRTLPPTVEVIAAGASDALSEAELWLASANGAWRGLSSLQRGAVHTTSVPVSLVTLDSLDLHGVTFIKIDVEGHEVPALRGAEQTIKRERPRLLIEVEQRRQPEGVAGVTGLLASWGYQGWVLPGRHWVPLDDFPLADRQAKISVEARGSLPRRFVWPYPRYVNLVLFLPEGQVPSGTAARQ